ncbi:ankyrin repeat-containing domain protein [Dendryphion nanum]|uniref:Ankyrin repeat-containing domain protein n=1 Tax=Dendryphion nanum TaxID=256645 RepID=A0A9P9DGH5_9PLEO|nr:ankyrin repeat-containing domain protein [Dendryphion nanum]
MDPFSIVIVVRSLLKELEQFRARLNPTAELLMLINSLTDLQVVLVTVQECANTLRESQLPASQQSHRAIIEALSKVQSPVDRLSEFIWNKILVKGNGISKLSLNHSKKSKLEECRIAIQEARRNLQTAMISANLRHTPTLLSIIEEASITRNDHHAKITASLEEIITLITTSKHPNGTDINAEHSSKFRNTHSRPCSTFNAAEIVDKRKFPLTDFNSHLCITTSIPVNSCPPFCRCQCHVRTQYRTPRWLSAVCGTLIYSSNINLSSGERRCNSKTCIRSRPSSTARFTYYFPTYIIKSAMVYSTWSNLSGKNSSWVIRMPREAPCTSPCWGYIYRGDENGIKQLLLRREMSPYDFQRGGASVLSMTVECGNLAICALLSAEGADWNLADELGFTPADKAWQAILGLEASNSFAIQLTSLVDPEDSHDLVLGSLHRIVLGLSSASLEQQLELDATRIDDQDWIGMTALMWAAARADHRAVEILLCHGADVYLSSREGRTALHYAASAASAPCVKRLLTAKANPCVVDCRGYNPLHITVTNMFSQDDMDATVEALVVVGAVTMTQRSLAGWTPLNLAIATENAQGIRSLAKHGSNIHGIDTKQPTALEYAIYNNRYRSLKILCDLNVSTSWPTPSLFDSNVLLIAAEHGTWITMNILTNSQLPRLNYDLRIVTYLFKRRKHLLYGELPEHVTSNEHEWDALQTLLERKGNRIDTLVLVEEANVDWESSQGLEEGCRIGEHDIDMIDCEGTEEAENVGNDVFVDALEDLVQM